MRKLGMVVLDKRKIVLMKLLKFFVIGITIFSFSGNLRGEEGNSKVNIERPSYRCYKIREEIRIDGKLTEKCWEGKPTIPFRPLPNHNDLAKIGDGSQTRFKTIMKIVWDDQYLYVGFDIKDPDVWARCGFRHNELRPSFKENFTFYQKDAKPETRTVERHIMLLDKFVKVFLDPDADGKGYIEFHVNALNNIFDACWKQGFKKKWGDRDRGGSFLWSCPGLITAVHVSGTLNAPHDIDEGWSMEMAIPWKALDSFTKGACPPKAGNIWGAYLGGLHRDTFDASGTANAGYWAWLTDGEKDNCHIPDTWGHLIFCNKLKKFKTAIGWGAWGLEEIIPKAADIGFTDIVTYIKEPKYLAKLVKVGQKYGIGIYSAISTLTDIRQWKKRYPGEAIPLQQMNERENEILAKLKQDNYKHQINFQWGEAPIERYNKRQQVLAFDMLCLHQPKVKEFLKEQIRNILKVPGIKGIAYDGFGYQNYQCCRCPHSMKLFEEYYKKHKDLKRGKALKKFSLETLVAFNNELADYARSIKPDVKIVNHIWPVFLAEPLYGNRLNIDYCGQTVTWYFYWDLSKIRRYAHIIAHNEKDYHSRANGVALLAFSHRPGRFPLKSPERIEAELKAILDGGCYRVIVDIRDMVKMPEVAAVFKKYLKNSK